MLRMQMHVQAISGSRGSRRQQPRTSMAAWKMPGVVKCEKGMVRDVLESAGSDARKLLAMVVLAVPGPPTSCVAHHTRASGSQNGCCDGQASVRARQRIKQGQPPQEVKRQPEAECACWLVPYWRMAAAV